MTLAEAHLNAPPFKFAAPRMRDILIPTGAICCSLALFLDTMNGRVWLPTGSRDLVA